MRLITDNAGVFFKYEDKDFKIRKNQNYFNSDSPSSVVLFDSELLQYFYTLRAFVK